jgi:DNA polymerase-1
MSPKTLTGAELDLNDAPARDAELFLVDGNNLAYRAFFALPEELATSEGFPTGALLGFTNMLFKLLSDYRPKGVAVAWDTRPVHRHAQAEAAEVVYKEGRRPMPDLLSEQFPHFRPIVEAFGYRNLEFEGWEADDVIATLATRADDAAIRTCVVSTDRDAFQLVSENVCLMMTPRGVSDVNVYTPDRVEARYGIRPDQIPDFIGLKGDTSDNIPGVPGIGDKTAGQLVAQYGSLEGVLEHVEELSPARRKNLTEFADQARAAKVLATMRRDLELDCDPAELVLAPPDRAQLRETFRQFEFRALLGRVEELDEAVPARERIGAPGTAVSWHEGEVPHVDTIAGIAVDDGRVAVALGDEVVVSPRPERVEGPFVAHDAKALRVEATDDTMILAYLIDPSRSEYLLDDLAAEYAVEAVAEPDAEEDTARLVRHAAVTLRLRDPLLERVRERGAEPLYRDVEMPLTGVLGRMQEAGVRIDTYRMGEITARLADRVEELESRAYELAGEEFVLGSPQQLGRILFEKLELTPGRKGKTGYSTDTKVLRSIRSEHEIVAVIEEWRELSKLLNTYLVPLPSLIGEDGRLHTTFNQTVAATGRLSTTSPNLQSIPIRTELGREIRSAFVSESGARLISADYSQIELRILAHVSGEPKLREAFARGEDIHTATAAEVLGVEPAKLTAAERSIAKMINFGIVYGISAFGLSENLEIPREQAQEYIDAYLARFPLVQDFISRTIEQAERDGGFGERVAVNFVMQGSNADIIKVAMVAIERRLREEGRSARLVLQVHDELLLEAPDAETSVVKELVREEMCSAYPLDPPLAVDVGAGDSWADAKS